MRQELIAQHVGGIRQDGGRVVRWHEISSISFCNRYRGKSVAKGMKVLATILFGCAAAMAQPVSVGIKGGLPLTDFLNAASGGQSILSATTNRYVVGPSIELRLPAGFGVEFDALYRHFSYNATTNLVDAISNIRTTGNDWEFPLLLKK